MDNICQDTELRTAINIFNCPGHATMRMEYYCKWGTLATRWSQVRLKIVNECKKRAAEQDSQSLQQIMNLNWMILLQLVSTTCAFQCTITNTFVFNYLLFPVLYLPSVSITRRFLYCIAYLLFPIQAHSITCAFSLLRRHIDNMGLKDDWLEGHGGFWRSSLWCGLNELQGKWTF